MTGFTAGADDYVSKPFSLRELMVRVEAVPRRSGKHLSDDQIHYAGILFDGRNLQAVKQKRSEPLTRREMDIVAYLFRRQDRIVSKAESLADPIQAATDVASAPPMEQRQGARRIVEKPDNARFQVEVAPLQAVAIDTGRMFIFRRIAIDGQIYRQGFVLLLQTFLDHLIAVFYETQPIARYTRLTLHAADLNVTGDVTGSNAGIFPGDGVAGRTYPAPFDFLTAELHAVALPPSPARQTLTLALIILGVVMVAGLVAIYHSAHAVLDLSERRSQFVSAVTRELKTPLTNIRMYIEMLDQGIAATPER